MIHITVHSEKFAVFAGKLPFELPAKIFPAKSPCLFMNQKQTISFVRSFVNIVSFCNRMLISRKYQKLTEISTINLYHTEPALQTDGLTNFS